MYVVPPLPGEDILLFFGVKYYIEGRQGTGDVLAKTRLDGGTMAAIQIVELDIKDFLQELVQCGVWYDFATCFSERE